MIPVSNKYKIASKKNYRNSFIVAKYGLYNKTAKKSTTVSANANNKPFSNLSQVLNEVKDTNYKYISCEPNRITLDGSYYFINDKNKVDDNQYLGYWSKEMSDENGNIKLLKFPDGKVMGYTDFDEVTLPNDVKNEFISKSNNLFDINNGYLNDKTTIENNIITTNFINLALYFNTGKKTIQLKPNTQYTFTLRSLTGVMSSNLYCYNIDGSILKNSAASEILINSLTFISPDSGVVALSVGGRSPFETHSYTLQLNEGTTALPYQPYGENIAWTNVGKVVLNGSEAWYLYKRYDIHLLLYTTTYEDIYIDANALENKRLLSDRLPNKSFATLNNNDEIGISLHHLNSRFYISIPKTWLSDYNDNWDNNQVTNALKSWLQANNVEIYYQLAEPIVQTDVEFINPMLEFIVDAPIIRTPLTLYFGECMSRFNIRYYLDDALLQEMIVENNECVKYETAFPNFTSKFNRVVVEFIQTQAPFRYVKFNELDFGVIETFTEREIVDVDLVDNADLYSGELTANSLSLTVIDDGRYDVLNPNNILRNLQEKQELTLFHYLKINGNYEMIPLGTFLLKTYQNQKNKLILNCYDDFYFMNKIYYGSKFYENARLETILIDLFNYFNYTKYEIADNVKSITLTGYVPNVQFREALRMIVEASQCMVIKDRFGITKIFNTLSVEAVETYENIEINTEKRLYNNVIDVVENIYNTKTTKEIYNAYLEAGVYNIMFDSYPAVNISGNVEFVNIYATSCKIIVDVAKQVIINGDVYTEEKIVHRIQKDDLLVVDEYAINKVDNTLITNNYYSIALWKLNRNEIYKNINIPVAPYIEVGDLIKIKTKYGNYVDVRIDEINIDDSIKQFIGGE